MPEENGGGAAEGPRRKEAAGLMDDKLTKAVEAVETVVKALGSFPLKAGFTPEDDHEGEASALVGFLVVRRGADVRLEVLTFSWDGEGEHPGILDDDDEVLGVISAAPGSTESGYEFQRLTYGVPGMRRGGSNRSSIEAAPVKPPGGGT
jgi:hypothetical protein